MSINHQEKLNDVDAALTDFDLHGDDATLPLDTARMELVRRTRDALKADAIKNGWNAQARREIDEHRRGIGRDAYNEERKAAYAASARESTGKLPRRYGEPDSPEKQQRRKGQKNASKTAKRDAMTAEQKKAENDARSQRRREQREREKAEAAVALKDRAIF